MDLPYYGNSAILWKQVKANLFKKKIEKSHSSIFSLLNDFITQLITQ
jgi:hypothetical protein